MQRRILAILVVALGAGVAALGQPPQPETFFKQRVQLPDSEIQKISHGQVVTKVLEAGDKEYGVLIFGAVFVNAPVARFADVVRNVKGLLSNKVYLAVQEFSHNGAPPKLSDFDRLQLDKADVDELEDCKVGDCDIQIVNIADLQKKVNWNSKDKYQQVSRLERERLYQMMTAYLSGGLKALGSYRDREKPFNLYDEMKSMVDSSFYQQNDRAPGIYHHIVDYAQGKLDFGILNWPLSAF
jgi:hypothetical protein